MTKKRTFLKWAATALTSAASPAAFCNEHVRPSADPFALGVASGAPTANGVLLWTRLIGLGVEAPSAIPVQFEVWKADKPQSPVVAGEAVALRKLGYAVHAEVEGLQAGRWYEYRFMVGDATSPVGRTRTLPAPGSMPERLRLAYASCQRWEDGHYAAYHHMLADEPDMVVFLGDYMYEYASRKADVAVRTHGLRHARTLDDYRARYALYRSDPALQAMHAACPWLITWDDHEVENDYAGVVSTAGTADLLAQRRAAYQAFYEFMPIRRSTWLRGLASMEAGEPLRIHQRVDLGRLASIHLLDNRQYRAAPLCGPQPSARLAAVCNSAPLVPRSMLGFDQEGWLRQGLEQAAAQGQRWNVIAQQTCFTPRNYPSGPGRWYGTDLWDGFPDARQRLLNALVASGAKNPVFLGGDIHQNWVAHVHQDPYNTRSPVVAAEFCGTSISSSGVTQVAALRALARNPHCLLANSAYRGYGIVDITPRHMTVSLRVLDDVKLPDSGVSTLAKFRVSAGYSTVKRL